MSFVSYRAIARMLPKLLPALALVAVFGCTREHYRQQADAEAYCLVNEKSNDPRWAQPGFSIELDPRSRYFDPYDPDRQPLPSDDPASHQLMRCVDGKKGWDHWYENGQRGELENPGWQEQLGSYVPMNEDGEVILSVDTALKLAYTHSPVWQQQLETVYLSALDVTTERFRLDTQFFAGQDLDFTHLGTKRGGGEASTLTLDAGGTGRGGSMFSRNFSRGGELLVNFANTFVWQFAGNNTSDTLSLFSWSLAQPLLRGAGQDIALEQLTIVERGLLANMRALTRYRRGFYTDVAIGTNGVTGPQRRGGFFGGTGLTGFTGQGAGGLGGVGGATGFGRGGGAVGAGGAGGGAGFAAGGAGTVGGFIGLLQQLQQIRNTQDNLNRQLRTLNLLESSLEAGQIDLTQVDQFRQNIESEKASLLQTSNGLLDSLENYKTGTLGLPPEVPMTLDDDLIQQFQFVDPEINDLESRIVDLQDEVGSLPDAPTTEQFEETTASAEAVRADLEAYFAEVQADLDQMENKSADRLERSTEDEREVFGRDKQLMEESMADIRSRFEDATMAIDALKSREDAAAATPELIVWLGDLLQLVQELTLVQARARLEGVNIDPVELDWESAYKLALENRLDMMNNRAALVDTWRLIQFNADALQSTVDVRFSGDFNSTRDRPFSFDSENSRMSVGLEIDGPFTRLIERNNYRQQLIEYQQDRRQFIRFRDGLKTTMRQVLRELNELQVNLEIQRRAMAIAIRRVDTTQEVLREPVPPAAPGEPQALLGPTAALNLLTALSDLRNTQNNFMSVWLNYYATRMLLIRELGLMQLDENGRWIDIPIQQATAMSPSNIDQLCPPGMIMPKTMTPEMFSPETHSAPPADEMPPLDVPMVPGDEAMVPPPLPQRLLDMVRNTPATEEGDSALHASTSASELPKIRPTVQQVSHEEAK